MVRTFDDGVGTLTEGLQYAGAEQRMQVVAEGVDKVRDEDDPRGRSDRTESRAEGASGCVES